MEITHAQLIYAAIAVVILVAFAYLLGAGLHRQDMLIKLENASNSGESIKIFGRYHKVMPHKTYLELLAKTKPQEVWDWKYANGKQR